MSDWTRHTKNMRRNIIIRSFEAGANGAHIAPSLSCVDILCALYGEVMRYDVSDFKNASRDRFILSKGHAGLALYTALCEFGIISQEQYASFEKNGGYFAGQPSKNISVGIEYSGGTLGLGLSYGIGLAQTIGQNRVYVLLGDGECNEGSVWESAMFAGFHKIKNLTVVVDCNKMQSDGNCEDILTFDIANMFQSCGFRVTECNGHDVDALITALTAEHDSNPLTVIAHTVKGKGIPFMENMREWHHARLTEKQKNEALSLLEESNGF